MGSMQSVNGVSVYRADPEGDPRGALIVIHEIWGLVDHIRDVADRYAAEGNLVMAPDLLSDAGVTPEIGEELFTMMNDSDDRVTAAVPFYGSVEPSEVASIHCPVLAFYGQEDERLIDALPAIEKAMTEAGVDFEAKIYPDAGHAFFNDTNPNTFDPDAAGDAWGRSLEFIRANVG